MKIFICILSFYHYEGDISIKKGDIIPVSKEKDFQYFEHENGLFPIDNNMIKKYFKEDQFALV